MTSRTASALRVHADTSPDDGTTGMQWIDTAEKLMRLAAEEIEKLEARNDSQDQVIRSLAGVIARA